MIAFSVLCPISAHTDDLNQKIRIADCDESFELETDANQICGYVLAPEDYSIPDGKQIEIPFLIVNPEELDTDLSPLLITGGGGPGSAYLQPYSVYGMDKSSYSDYLSMSTHEHRQLIILENRGVGKSVPGLDCPEVEDGVISYIGLPDGEWQDVYISLLEKCVIRLRSEDHDLNQYNVSNAARDIEFLRTALIDVAIVPSRILNLYGVSYGARVAMYYEMMFPEFVKSMILDSVAIQEFNPTKNYFINSQRALDMLFSSCREDSHCNSAYGENLESDYYRYLNELHENPIPIELVHPYTLENLELLLNEDTLSNIVFNKMYDAYDRSDIPFVLRTAMNGSMVALSMAYTNQLHGEMKDSLSEAAFYSYLCFDNQYHSDDMSEFIETESENYPALTYWSRSDNELMPQICELLNVDVEVGYLTRNHAIKAPALLLSGEADPVTPPANAEIVASRSLNAWKIDWPNIPHHVVAHSYCVEYIAIGFLSDPLSDPTEHFAECEYPEFDNEFMIH